MSVINKKPYIQTVVESLTDEQLASLATLLNGASVTKFKSFINNTYAFTNDDKGVSHCVLEAKDKIFTGYLLYNSTYCVLVAYQEQSQKMQIVKLNLAEDKYEISNEELSILEFRQIVAGNGGSGGGGTEGVFPDGVITPEISGGDEATASVTIKNGENNDTSIVVGPDEIEANGDVNLGEHHALKFGNGVSIGKEDAQSMLTSGFKHITAPSSTTLSDDEITAISKGVFIDGTLGGYTNFILMPYIVAGSYAQGMFWAPTGSGQVIGIYSINMSTKGIVFFGETNMTNGIKLQNVKSLNGKAMPSWPADTGTFAVKVVNGVLTFVEE